MIEFAAMVFHQLTYSEAWMYCVTLEYDGHKDWRLPTLNEWSNSSELLGWYENASPVFTHSKRAVCPVRDI
jgi:hypothetical protein